MGKKVSNKVWLVTENGYEHTTPLIAYTSRSQAQSYANRAQQRHADDVAASRDWSEPLHHRVVPIDLVGPESKKEPPARNTGKDFKPKSPTTKGNVMCMDCHCGGTGCPGMPPGFEEQSIKW